MPTPQIAPVRSHNKNKRTVCVATGVDCACGQSTSLVPQASPRTQQERTCRAPPDSIILARRGRKHPFSNPPSSVPRATMQPLAPMELGVHRAYSNLATALPATVPF